MGFLPEGCEELVAAPNDVLLIDTREPGLSAHRTLMRDSGGRSR
jgi:hypothetical protein